MTRLIKQYRFHSFNLNGFIRFSGRNERLIKWWSFLLYFIMFLITMMISIDSLNAKLILVVIFSIACRFLHGTDNKLLIWLHTPLQCWKARKTWGIDLYVNWANWEYGAIHRALFPTIVSHFPCIWASLCYISFTIRLNLSDTEVCELTAYEKYQAK